MSNGQIHQQDESYRGNVLYNSDEQSVINTPADVKDIFISNLDQKGTKLFYDYGNYINENRPKVDLDSINDLRSDCKNKINKLIDIKNNMDEFEDDYDLIEDVLVLFKDTYELCKSQRNKESFDADIIDSICRSYNKACESYIKNVSMKGRDE